MLNAAQLAIFKAELFAEVDAELVALRNAGATNAIADWYNQPTTHVVWKTLLTEHEIVDNTSPEATVWNWTDYIARAQSERDAWERIFNGTYTINPSIPQVRSGIADIFSGPQGANQRTHLLAIAKRFATRGEKLFANGTGTNAAPATLTFEGSITDNDVVRALYQ